MVPPTFVEDRRGAALVVAMAVAAVVLLSTMLLLGYIEGMVSDMTDAELGAQAELSQRAAVEQTALMLKSGAITPGSPLPDDILAGMTTSFDVVQTGGSGPRVEDLDLPREGLEQLLPSRGFLAAYARNGNLVLDHLGPNGRRSQGFPLDMGPLPEAWDVAGYREGDYLAAVVRQDGDECLVTLVRKNGSTLVTSGQLSLWREGGNVEAGFYGGEPAVVATNGRNWGHLVLPESGRMLYFWSDPGTSPAVTSNGSLFGNLSSNGVSGLPGPEVLDRYEADVDSDGRPDLIWVTDRGIACFLGGRQVLVTDSFAGGNPLAWGGLDPWSGLAVLWREPEAGLRWRRLSWNGFVDMGLTGGAFEQAWRGRLESGDGIVVGVVDGRWCILLPDGNLQELCAAEGSYSGDFDGLMGPDVVRGGSGGLRAWMNPAAGMGNTVLVEARTRDGRGRLWLEQGWLYSIFEDRSGGREVYVEKAQ